MNCDKSHAVYVTSATGNFYNHWYLDGVDCAIDLLNFFQDFLRFDLDERFW
jgi:hypothetical protein